VSTDRIRVIVNVRGVQCGVDSRRTDLDRDQRIEVPDGSFKGDELRVLIREYPVTRRVVIDAQSDTRLQTDMSMGPSGGGAII
jgi:hypothetical protein